MKNIKLYFLLIAAIFLFTSCDNQQVKMRTVINRDGTCIREVSYQNVMTKAERDSLWKGDKPQLSYPVPDCLIVDSLKESHTEIDGDTVITNFSNSYNTVEEMSANTPLLLSGIPLKSKAHLKKVFHFFYTEYVFSETFNSIKDRYSIQPENYAKPDVVSYWFTGKPNLLDGMNGAEAATKLKEIEPLVTNWMNDNIASAVFSFIAEHYDSIVNPPLSKESFIAQKDSLIRYYISKGDYALLNTESIFESFFHSNAYNTFFDDEFPLGSKLSKIVIEQIEPLSFKIPYTINMPGTIMGATGGAYITDNNVTFYISGERLIPKDYTITVTSRVTNIWALILTGFIIIIAIASFLWKKKVTK